MYPEQTSLMIELLKSSDVFSSELSNGTKAQIWRNLADQCNALIGGRKRTVDQYKRHWYDLKMKVKNKLLRRQEAFCVPGTTTIPDHMELTDDEHYVALFVKNMEGMEEIVQEAMQSATTPRTRDQTAMLLKLVHTNREHFKKKNMAERQKIWKTIADTLNKMTGPEKSIDSWKKAYWCWRLQAGDDYEQEIERWIKKAPAIMPDSNKSYNDDMDFEVISNKSTIDQQEAGEESMPSDTQEQRLYELLAEHRALLRAGSSEEPIKKQIWTNIANELNNMPGIELSVREWRQRCNWGKLIAHLDRKKRPNALSNSRTVLKSKRLSEVITFDSEDVNNLEYEILDSHVAASDNTEEIRNTNSFSKHSETDNSNDFVCEDNAQNVQILKEEYEESENDEFLYLDEEESEQQHQQKHHSQQQQRQQQQEQPQQMLEQSIAANEKDADEYKPTFKRLRSSPPIVKSFKFTNRIVNAVEILSTDVNEMKDVLMQTANSLASIEEIMQRQNEKQDETNELLKRNNQLLKLLVEYKTGKRTKAKSK